MGDWVMEHKLLVALASLLVVGGIGRQVYRLCDCKHQPAQRRRSRRAMAASTKSQEPHRDVVGEYSHTYGSMCGCNLIYCDPVILGVDATDYGKAIVQHFLDNEYIVIASTLSTEVADEIEKTGNGYARALVLDAEEVWLAFTHSPSFSHLHVLAWLHPPFPEVSGFNTLPSLPYKYEWRSLRIHHILWLESSPSRLLDFLAFFG